MKESIKNLVVLLTLFLTLALSSASSGEPNAIAVSKQKELEQPSAAAEESNGSPVFKQEELEQLVAPIALYPDSLISQILMASTYPLEVKHASEWVKQNKDLDAGALEKKSWDPSVKSLVNFPQVLTMMSDKLDWTQKLGDAFLSQQKGVMDAVQKLRSKAYEKGSLKTTEEQVVKKVEPDTIVIESAEPNVVYVPNYSATDAYGEWPYSDYPPYDYYEDGYYGSGYYGGGWYGSGSRFLLGAAWGYAKGNPDWNAGDIRIDTQGGMGKWQYDPAHRRGVPYRDQATAQRFNRASTPDAVKSREAYRGRAGQGRQDLARGNADRSKGRQGVGQRGGSQARDRAGTRDISSRGSYDRGSAFQDMDRGSSARNYSSRGQASRQSMSRPSGGGRGGGGRR
jgi:hypothetical protein